jgi:uncharacterized protein YutE (UPF0331/DUF86 family)
LVDGERVLGRLRRLDALLEILETARAAGEDAYLSDRDLRLRTERALQLALQVCIDVGAHVISELGVDAPESYRGVFATLANAEVLEPRLAERLGMAAGLRNLLVHGYADLDDRQVWAALGRLDDLRAFAAAVARAVDER